MPAIPLDRLERLFKAAQMHPPEERTAFLQAACADDPRLLDELLSLLAHDQQADHEAFLDEPPTAGLLPPALPDPSAADDPLHGRRVGPYLLERPLGHGGMGTVYLARRDEPFKQYVALKIIRRGLDTEEVLQRFAMERQILAALNHPHIARLLDGGSTEDHLAYFVMEYVEGRPLTAYCDQRRLGVPERLRLFQTVCQAVHYAHQNLILHRDLKPSNILVTDAGEVKLLDFGIAKLLNPHLSPEQVPVTRTELRRMTPEYASPEQVRGEGLTTASDVYALGVILYELLTGRRPYQLRRGSTRELERAVCEQEPVRPSTRVGQTATALGGSETRVRPETLSEARGATVERLRRWLRGDLDNIVLKALRKEPGRRYASAEQLAADVGRHQAGLPVEARPNTMGYRMYSFIKRHRVGVAAAVLVTFSLVGGLSLAVWKTSQTRQALAQAEQALAQSEEVSAFLTGLFEATDPNRLGGEEVSARDLLDRGVAQIETLEDQPEVQVHLLDVIGRVYWTLGAYEQAAPLFIRALARRRTFLPPDHLDIAKSLNNAALIQRTRNDLAGAETLHQEALDMYRRLQGPESAEIARTLTYLGFLRHMDSDRETAARYYQEALAMQKRFLGENHPDLAETLRSLAFLELVAGHPATADSLYQASYDIYSQVYGTTHTRLATVLRDRSIVALEQDNPARAEALLRRSLDMQRTLMGDDSPTLTPLIAEIGDALARQQRYEEAEQWYQDALARNRKLRGPNQGFNGRLLRSIGDLYVQQGDYAKAEPYFLEAWTLYTTHFADDLILQRRFSEHIAAFYTAWGKPEKAALYHVTAPSR